MAREQEVIRLLLLLFGAWSTSSTSPSPVCAGSLREPVVLGQTLEFCGGDAGLSCCNADDDAGLRAELDGMRISDAACFAILKDVLCAATRAYSSEVRRIFTMGLPYPHTSYSYQHHGGQILFWPSDSDGYLYLVTGNGDFSNNGRSFFGKILRFYVGGSFVYCATPKIEKPQIFAVGLNNPNGCSFDSNRPSYLYCADVNEKRYELVHLITRGRNYSGSSMKVTVSSIINQGHPADGRMPSIVGGLMYRGSADPLLKGRYLYVYASSVWTGVDALESRSNGRSASAQVPIVRCSRSSPVPCNGIGITGRVLSLGEDSSKDAFVLATRGVFRLVPSSLCGVTQPLP